MSETQRVRVLVCRADIFSTSVSAQLEHKNTHDGTLQRLQEARQPDDVGVIEQVEKEILDLSDLLRATQIQEKDADLLVLQTMGTWNERVCIWGHT